MFTCPLPTASFCLASPPTSAGPLLNKLGKWIAGTYKTVLPKSPTGKAMAYCIPRRDNLMNYLKDGSLEIDNNLAENAIRPIALGRKSASWRMPDLPGEPRGLPCFIPSSEPERKTM